MNPVTESCSTSGAVNFPVCQGDQPAVRFGWRASMAQLCRCAERIACLVVGIGFLASSVPHLTNPYHFLASVYSYELVGPGMGKVVAMVLPHVQLVTAVCLIGNIFVRRALATSCGMLAVFVGAQLSSVVRGQEITCGCFGPNYSSRIGFGSILLVSFLLSAAIAGLICCGVNARERREQSGQPC